MDRRVTDKRAAIMKSSIILAAGLGKRVREYSIDLPKPLIKINEKPFIEYSINIMEELGFEEIFVNVHYKADQIISYLKNLNNPKIKISDETDCLLDTGGGIKKIMDENKLEKVFILNCDNLWKDEDTVLFREMIESFPKDIMSLLALTPIDLISGYEGKGDFLFTKDDHIQRYGNTINKGYVFNGAQIIRKEAFKDIKNNVFSINKVWDDLISKKLIKGYKFNKNVLHLGTTTALKKYENKL